MRTLLIDDEPHNCELLETLIRLHLPDKLEVIGHANSVDAAASILRSTPADLVFLDIQMPGKNGFELLKHFPQPAFEVIFITSYEQYALPAFQADAVDYLLKPVAVDELRRAVDKAARMRLARTIYLGDAETAVQSGKIPVHEGGQVLYIDISEIVSLEADGRYTHITLVSGAEHVVSKHLKLVEDSLAEGSGFRRVSRSLTLNIRYVQKYSKSEPFTVVMANGRSFPVSRRKRTEILSELRSLLR